MRFLKDLEEELKQNTDKTKPVYITINGPLHIGDNVYYCQQASIAQEEEEEGVNEAFK